ncbi:hypothetical protein ACWCSH_16125, partial [Streptosporangium sp. NPDC001682]
MRSRTLLPRRITLRARLTLIYGGLFLVAGIVLLGATYTLFSQQLTSRTKVITIGYGGGLTRIPARIVPSTSATSPLARVS